MCHDHAPAAVSLAPQFVHSISVGINIFRPNKGDRKVLRALPVMYALVQHSEIALPHISDDLLKEVSNSVLVSTAVGGTTCLAAREATNWYDHPGQLA